MRLIVTRVSLTAETNFSLLFQHCQATHSGFRVIVFFFMFFMSSLLEILAEDMAITGLWFVTTGGGEALLVAEVVLDTLGQRQLVDVMDVGGPKALPDLEAGQRHQGQGPRLQPVQIPHRDLAVTPHSTGETRNMVLIRGGLTCTY